MRVAYLVLLSLVLTMVQTVAQAPPTIGPNDSIGFDYPDAALTAEAIVRFESQYDAGQWTPIGIPTKVATVGGISTYAAPDPPYTTGQHSVVFRACNAANACAPASTPPFVFVAGSSSTTPTTPVTNVRKIAKPAAKKAPIKKD